MNNNAEQQDHIEAFLLGKLPPEAQSDFEAAMRRDTALAEAVELRRLEFEVAEALIANDIRAQMSRLREEHPPDEATAKPETSGLSLRFWLLFAALLCCAAFVVLRWTNSPKANMPSLNTTVPTKPDTPKLPIDSPQTPETRPQNPPIGVPPKATTDKAGRLQALRLYQKPDLGGLRGNETSSSSLTDALNAWEKGDYAEASRLASAIAPQEPNYWKAQYLCAHAAFLRQQYTEASRLFVQIADSKAMPWAEEADWYALLALIANDQKGIPVFDKVYQKIKNDSDHPYHTALKQIK